jgi:CBS domain-containing protein
MANYHLRARDIMQTEIATILPDLTVQDAAFLMKHNGVRSLIVEKDSDDDAYGIVTYADIVDKVLAYNFDPAEVSVAEIMTKPLVVANPSLKADLIAKLFAKHNIGHAPVIENHKLVGVVSMTDLIVEVITDPEDVQLALPERKMRSLPAPKEKPAKKPTKRRQKAKARRP